MAALEFLLVHLARKNPVHGEAGVTGKSAAVHRTQEYLFVARVCAEIFGVLIGHVGEFTGERR